MKLTIALLTIFISGVAFASGKGVGSLLAPAVNVTILVAALVYFLRTPVKEFFSTKSSSVSEMLDRASSKAKEAEEMMQAQKKKTLGADGEIKNLEQKQADLLKNFESEYVSDVATRIERMKEDAGHKVEAEKKELLNKLNESLIDLVVSKAKTQIKGNKALCENTTKNIVEGI